MEYLNGNLTIYNATYISLDKTDSKITWRIRSKFFQIWPDLEIELKIFNLDPYYLYYLNKERTLKEVIEHLNGEGENKIKFQYFIGKRTLSFSDYIWYSFRTHYWLDNIILNKTDKSDNDLLKKDI
jgi:hypothetical protein